MNSQKETPDIFTIPKWNLLIGRHSYSFVIPISVQECLYNLQNHPSFNCDGYWGRFYLMQLRNIKEDEATFRVDICSRFVPILGATMKGTIEELGRETKVSIRITALPGNYLCLMIPGILSIMAALSLLVDIKNISRLVPIIFILIIYIPYFFRIQSYYWIALSKNLHNTLHREENE